jgi:DNA primase
MDTSQEIKNRLSIVDVVREYATLHPSGSTGNYKMICPFHDDHSPSMVVNEKKGLAWCFVCNSGGDIFSFVQKIENCSFPEAVRLLADKAGIQMEKYIPETKKDEKEMEGAYRILEETTEFFEKQLAENPRAKKELEKRRLPKDVIKKFHIGFAPKSENALEKHLLEKGYSRKEMTAAGLLVVIDASGKNMRDKFRDRLMFPIWNSRGRICAFGGRYIGSSDKAPKYLNSPETTVFKKSEIMYGLHLAKEAIKKEGFVIVTEGYFDVIACHAAGIENVVATSGTAFTQDHAKILGRIAKEVAFSLDVDDAGQAATRRSAAITLSKEIPTSVITIPGGKDPDEAIRENKEDFCSSITQRENAMDVFFTRAFSLRNPKQLQEKKAILDELLPVISSLSREIERDHYLQMLAQKIGSSVHVLQDEYSRFSRFRSQEPQKPKATTGTFKICSLEYLAAILLSFPELTEEVMRHLLFDLLEPGEEKKIYKRIRENYNHQEGLSSETIFKELSEKEAEKWRILAVYAEEKNGTFSDEVRKKETIKIVQSINSELISKKMKSLGALLKENAAEAPTILSQMNELTKLLQKFHHQ